MRVVFFTFTTFLCLGVGWSAAPKQKHPEALFHKKLKKNDQVLHALDRLTFGPRPEDFALVQRIGLKNWIDEQLHPDRIPENPILLARLEPLKTLRQTPLEIWEDYPQQQYVLSVFTGQIKMPDDPAFRGTMQRYASYYKLDESDPEKKNTFQSLSSTEQLADLLTKDEIKILKTGKPEEKTRVLARIPEERADAVLIAMDNSVRGQVQNFAPVWLKRRLYALSAPQSVLNFDLLSAKLDRAIYSNRQLQEQLVDFWYNHFNVYLDKGNERFVVPSYERDAIRPHVLGKFRDLLLATAESPAMLYYLDNFQSVAPAVVKPGTKPKPGARGLNENYGRELLELHTMGVDGGYTQKDIIEVARCFTGWTIDEQRKGSGFLYNDKVHDKGEKTVLGVTIPAGGGQDDGLKVIDILVQHPSTARFLSTKLAERFVADQPPKRLIDDMAKTFQRTGGDIREVLQTMLKSKEFWSLGAYRSKLKSPLEMIASAARATNADVQDSFALANSMANLGQPLYRKVEPTGYLNTSAEWINSGSLLNRMNFALNFAQNRVNGVKMTSLPEKLDVDQIAQGILFGPPAEQTRQAIASALAKQQVSAKPAKPVPPGLVAGLVLGSPEFQRR